MRTNYGHCANSENQFMLSNGLTTAPIAGEPCRKSPIFKTGVLIQVKSNRMTGDILGNHLSKMDDVVATEWLKCRRIERGIVGLHHLFCVKYCNDVSRPSSLGMEGLGCKRTKHK